MNQSRGSTCRSSLLKDDQVVERILWSVVKDDRKIQVKFRCKTLMFILQITDDLPVTIFFGTVHVYFLAMLPSAAISDVRIVYHVMLHHQCLPPALVY